jgi:ABC-type transport system involved in multi-copper enzyme maturation permease subunit
MTRLIGSELLKLRKRGMTWILLYVLIGIMILLHLILFAISRISLPHTTPSEMGNLQNLLGLPVALPFALSILSSFGAVLAVILMASSAGNEYNWRTIRLALISSESRARFLAAKIISVGIIIVIGMLIALLTGFVMSLVTTAIGGNKFDFAFATGGYLWDQFAQFWRTYFVILTFTLMGFFFAILGRSAMPGIAIGIGIAFLEPIITSFMRLAGGWVSSIPNYLFSANISAINTLNKLPGRFSGGGGFGGLDVSLPSVDQAFIVLTVYMLVFLALGFYLFHKRDVTG